ncbi:hypothetical protein, partial [Pseudarthrobacter sp. NamE2]|uniref:hypothetical protein n=1 Tax=Pseudarthrobacter sp. NamE2 TaxID=2576838 RepID=UPI00197AAC83
GRQQNRLTPHPKQRTAPPQTPVAGRFFAIKAPEQEPTGAIKREILDSARDLRHCLLHIVTLVAYGAKQHHDYNDAGFRQCQPGEPP